VTPRTAALAEAHRDTIDGDELAALLALAAARPADDDLHRNAVRPYNWRHNGDTANVLADRWAAYDALPATNRAAVDDKRILTVPETRDLLELVLRDGMEDDDELEGVA
jgi:hypothetical protein